MSPFLVATVTLTLTYKRDLRVDILLLYLPTEMEFIGHGF